MATTDQLHPHEKKVLLALQKLEKATAAELAVASGLPEASVHKASLWATLKGLVSHQEATTTTVALTPEGKSYRTAGLPEKRLLLLLAQGKTLAQLKGTPELTIGLGWAKKNGWVNAKLAVTPAGERAYEEKTPQERALETLKGDARTLEELKKRNLITLTDTTTKTFVLTPEGQITPITETDAIGQLTPDLIASGDWKRGFRAYDANSPVPAVYPAKIHPTIRIINTVRHKLMALGFQEIRGPFTELEFWNCDALFMPHDHPARGIHDIFHLKLPLGTVSNLAVLERVSRAHKGGIHGSAGWGSWDSRQTLNTILRSHLTCLNARTLAARPKPPAMFFSIGRVFRPDVLDATHSFEFYQCEGIVVGDLHFRHLLGFLKLFATDIAGAKDVRFRPHYFPFTEPSVEMDVLINGKWMELAGAGIFRPEMTQPLGVDVPVLGWGIGFSRLVMITLGLSDIRDLTAHDLDYLRKKPLE